MSETSDNSDYENSSDGTPDSDSDCELQSDEGTIITHLQRNSSCVQSRGHQALGRQPASFPVAGSEIANSALEN